jgi:hypothetical protein
MVGGFDQIERPLRHNPGPYVLEHGDAPHVIQVRAKPHLDHAICPDLVR